MVLAEPRRAVAVFLQDATDRRLVRGDDAVVSRVSGRLLRDDTEAGRVVVPPRDEGCARRRAECRRVEVRVAQPVPRDAVERRRRDHAAEGARDAVARVVGHDQQHVRRALGRHDARRPVRLRALRRGLDLAAELLRRRRQLVARDRHRGRRRTRRAVDLLGVRAGTRKPEGRHQTRKCDKGARLRPLHPVPDAHVLTPCVGVIRPRRKADSNEWQIGNDTKNRPVTLNISRHRQHAI